LDASGAVRSFYFAYQKFIFGMLFIMAQIGLISWKTVSQASVQTRFHRSRLAGRLREVHSRPKASSIVRPRLKNMEAFVLKTLKKIKKEAPKRFKELRDVCDELTSKLSLASLWEPTLSFMHVARSGADG
jgi:Ca2+-dependent lipid-binding protein